MSEWDNLWKDGEVQPYEAGYSLVDDEWITKVRVEGDRLQEQLKDCSEAHKVLYNNAFKIPELQQKLEAIQAWKERYCLQIPDRAYNALKEVLGDE